MNYDIFIDAITKEIEKTPSATLYKERGRLRQMNGDKKGALEDIRTALKMDPTLLDGTNGEYKL